MVKQSSWLPTLVVVSMLFHAVWVAIALFLFLGGPFGSSRPALWQWLRDVLCRSCEHSYDAVNAAAQLGRLDLIALSLTVLGTVLAFGAFASFFLIRGAAVNAAAEEGANCVSAMLPSLLTTEMVSQAILNDERVKLTLMSAFKTIEATENQIPEGTANKIAAAFDEDKDEY